MNIDNEISSLVNFTSLHTTNLCKVLFAIRRSVEMREVKNSEIQKSLEEKCWKLSSYLLSQYDYKVLSHPIKEHWCIFENNFRTNFETYFYRDLIELSSLIRTRLDSESIKIKETVGELITNGESTELSFREACNKIIHSLMYDIEFNSTNKHPLFNGVNGYLKKETPDFKNPIIVTSGSHREKEWIARIEFFTFIEQTMNL
jgi:hypothetical protein